MVEASEGGRDEFAQVSEEWASHVAHGEAAVARARLQRAAGLLPAAEVVPEVLRRPESARDVLGPGADPRFAREVIALLARAASERGSTALDEASRQRCSIAPGGQGVSVWRVGVAIATEADPGRRSAWFAARERALAPAEGELERGVAAMCDAVAEAGGADPVDVACRACGTSAADARDLAEGVLADTEDAWADVGGFLARRELGAAWLNMSAADFSTLRAAPRLQAVLSPPGVREAALRVARDSGLWAGLQVEERAADALGPPNPVAAPRSDGHGANFVLPPGGLPGPVGWRHALGALGEAAARAALDPDLPATSRATWRSGVGGLLGEVLGSIASAPKALARYARVRADPDERRLLGWIALDRLRRSASRALASLAVLEAGPGERGRDWAEEALRRGAGAPPSPLSWLLAADPSLRALEVLRVAPAAAGLASGLRERWDEEWWRVPEAAASLVAAARSGGGMVSDAAFAGLSPSTQCPREHARALAEGGLH